MALAVHMPQHQHAICWHMTRLCRPPPSPASCREWKQACINTIHQPTVTGSHPPHDNHTGDYSPFSFLTWLLILLFFFGASCIHPSWLVTATTKFTSAQSDVLCSRDYILHFILLFFFFSSFTSYSFSLAGFFQNQCIIFCISPSLFSSFSYCLIFLLYICVIHF